MKVYTRDKFVILRVNSIESWVAFLMELSNQRGASFFGWEYEECERWIFRGQGNADWPLSTTYERIRHKTCLVNLQEYEWRVNELDTIEKFKRSAIRLYSTSESLDLIDWLALMQHYCAPTRLLDFTYSAFVALFFAITTTQECDFAVWAICLSSLTERFNQLRLPKELRVAMRDESAFEVGQQFASKYVSRFAAYWQLYRGSLDAQLRRCKTLACHLLGRKKSGSPRRTTKLDILPVHPAQNNERMAAQSGLFLMPTRLSESFEDNLKNALGWKTEVEFDIAQLTDEDREMIFKEGVQIKFIFSKELFESAKLFLTQCNISYEKLFPGLEGVAKSVDYFGIIKESTAAMRLFKFIKMKMDAKNGEEITEENLKS